MKDKVTTQNLAIFSSDSFMSSFSLKKCLDSYWNLKFGFFSPQNKGIKTKASDRLPALSLFLPL